MAVSSIPEGYHAVIPYLVTSDADTVITFLKQTFDAEVVDETRRPDGTVMHADVQIGDSHVMLGQAGDRFLAMPSAIYIYVPDCDATYNRALEAHAESIMEPADQFYGDRNAGIKDVCGNIWWIGTHVEDVPPDELARRAARAAGQH